LQLRIQYRIFALNFILFMNKIFILFAATLISCSIFAQNYTIRGKITDASNGESLPDFIVRISSSSMSSKMRADGEGLFSFSKLVKGTYKIVFRSAEYDSIVETVIVTEASGVSTLSIQLKPKETSKNIDDVTVTADQIEKKTEIGMSQISLDKKAIERIPSQGAEADITAAFSVTPGVVTTGDQGGQLYVRGGTPIQNKVLLEGMTVYSPFHSIGFFSVFETELVKNVDIYTGGFDARYGGRISSIMDISYRDGNKNKIGGKFSLSPFMAKAVLEGPLKKNKSGRGGISYIFTVKNSLIDQTSKTLYKRVNDGLGMPFDFTDVFGKVTFQSGTGSKASFFGFRNEDKVNYFGLANLGWTATGGGANFTLIPGGSPIIIRGHINGSNYNIRFLEDAIPERKSSIGGYEIGFDFTYFLKGESELNYGVSLNAFKTDYVTYNEAARLIKANQNTQEISAYVNYRKVKTQWVFQPGFRLQYYNAYQVVSPEPRLAIKFNATEKFRIKVAAGRYSQNFTSASSDRDIVNLFNGLLTAPSNVQKLFTNEKGKTREVQNGLQYAYHLITGVELDVSKDISLNIEPYYKFFQQLSNININKIYDTDVTGKPDIETKDFLIEEGKSYGIDLTAKYSKNRFYLWVAYSLSRSTRFDGFQLYAPVFDRRHNANIVTSYNFGKKKDLEVSIRWNIGSGLPFTPTAGFYQPEGFTNGVTSNYVTSNSNTVGVLLGDYNSERLPSYHRLDVTAKKSINFKNKNVLEITGGVTNVYNRKNIFYVNRFTYKTIYQFPIIASLGISFKF
jgi:Carboxypeptidase regulatory-like domain/TonB-dependent Receptor Plug Domain